MPAPLRPTDPRYIGRYRLLSRLGEGGMGSVFLASAPTGRPVAVKVIRPEYAHEPEFRARFRGEVDRARQVPPFCTAEVLDADPEHVTPYLVVEYVDGPSLSEVVDDRGPLTGGSLHGVAVGVATALAAIHGAGVIHRDLKPRNVLFALGTPKVIDFGIARPLEPTSFHTRAEEMVGTLAYMAPERFDTDADHHLTPAVDVFAWGALVTYAGTGRTPFGGDIPTVTAAHILTQPPRLGDLPPYLAELVLAALEKSPSNRPSAPELLDRLLVSGSSPSAPSLPIELRREAEAAAHYRTGTGWSLEKRGRKRRTAAITAIALATVAAVGAGTVLRNREPTPAEAPPPPSAPAAVAGPSLFDALRGPGFVNTSTDQYGTCTYRNGLRVTAKTADAAMCALTPYVVFPPTQTIAVSATLADARSCAAIVFRAVGEDGNLVNYFRDGYLATICPGEVRLASTIGGAVSPIAAAKRPTAPGKAHRISLATTDRSATVAIDGADVLDGMLTESALVSGRVLLGASTGRVTYTDAELRSGADPAAPAVPPFATGDAQFTAGMWTLYDAGGVAIVEPTEFLSGREYCRRFALADSSPRCSQKYVPATSSLAVSLPLADKPAYLDYRRNPQKCRDSRTRAGTCPVSFREFSTTTDGTSPWPAVVTIKAGKVTSVARLDLA
ncbi:serine/threonine-protein kinase [Actinoplanes sp. CA-142083]|uniref:serine/threonine-protein kinase n=1 Tax=Actinoplanes sp. CA-142083 TaxID=3239903 RepID=UPI003D8CEB08